MSYGGGIPGGPDLEAAKILQQRRTNAYRADLDKQKREQEELKAARKLQDKGLIADAKSPSERLASLQDRQSDLLTKLGSIKQAGGGGNEGVRSLARQFASELALPTPPPMPAFPSRRGDSPPPHDRHERFDDPRDNRGRPGRDDPSPPRRRFDEPEASFGRRNGIPNYWALDRDVGPPAAAEPPADRRRIFDEGMERTMVRPPPSRPDRDEMLDRRRPDDRDFSDRDFDRDRDRAPQRDRTPPRGRFEEPPYRPQQRDRTPPRGRYDEPELDRRRDDRGRREDFAPPRRDWDDRDRDRRPTERDDVEPSHHRRASAPVPPPSSAVGPSVISPPSFARPSHNSWTSPSGVFTTSADASAKAVAANRAKQQYQESLKQQIAEQADRKKREKEEDERIKKEELAEVLEMQNKEKKEVGKLVHQVAHQAEEQSRTHSHSPRRPSEDDDRRHERTNSDREPRSAGRNQRDQRYEDEQQRRPSSREREDHAREYSRQSSARGDPRDDRGRYTERDRERDDDRRGGGGGRDRYEDDRDRHHRGRSRGERDELADAMDELQHTDLASHATRAHPDSEPPLVPMIRALNEKSHLRGGGVVTSANDVAGTARANASNLQLKQNLDAQLQEKGGSREERKRREIEEEKALEAKEEARIRKEREELQARYDREIALEKGLIPPPLPPPGQQQAPPPQQQPREVFREREPERRVAREREPRPIEAFRPTSATPPAPAASRPQSSRYSSRPVDDYDPLNYSQSPERGDYEREHERGVDSDRRGRHRDEYAAPAAGHRSDRSERTGRSAAGSAYRSGGASNRGGPLTDSVVGLMHIEADANRRIAELAALERERIEQLARLEESQRSSAHGHLRSQLSSHRSMDSQPTRSQLPSQRSLEIPPSSYRPSYPPSPQRSTSPTFKRSPPQSPARGGSFEISGHVPALPTRGFVPRASISPLEQSLHSSSAFHAVPDLAMTMRRTQLFGSSIGGGLHGLRNVSEHDDDDAGPCLDEPPMGILQEKSLFVAPDGTTSAVPVPFQEPPGYDVNSSSRVRIPLHVIAATSSGMPSPTGAHRFGSSHLFSSTFAIPSSNTPRNLPSSHVPPPPVLSPSSQLLAAATAVASLATPPRSLHVTSSPRSITSRTSEYSSSFLDGSIQLHSPSSSSTPRIRVQPHITLSPAASLRNSQTTAATEETAAHTPTQRLRPPHM